MYDKNIENIVKAKEGSEEAMTELVETNKGLVWSIVKRFCISGFETEDLYQIGCMGLIKAIKRFDVNYDVKLSTYAVPYILGEIKKHIRDDGIIKISRSIKELNMKISKLEEDHLRKTGKDLSLNELEKKLNVSKEEIIIALESRRPVESIYKEENSNNEKGAKILDKIQSNKNEEEWIVNKLTINELIKNLGSKERQVIILRFYKNKTQSQVGEILGISQVQVSRIEKSVLNKMRMNLEAV